MATVITESATYAATVTAPDDADPLNAASVVAPGVGFQALADRTLNIVSRVGGTLGNAPFEFVDNLGASAPRSVQRIIGAFAMTEGAQASLGAATTAQWWSVAQFIGGAASFSRTSQFDRAVLITDVSRWVPIGSTLTRIEALVAPGVARAVVGDRMLMELFRQTPNFAVPAIPTGSGPIGADSDDGGFNVQLLDSGVISEAVDRTSHLALKITAGDDAGTNKDDVHCVRFTYTTPGPMEF